MIEQRSINHNVSEGINSVYRRFNNNPDYTTSCFTALQQTGIPGYLKDMTAYYSNRIFLDKRPDDNSSAPMRATLFVPVYDEPKLKAHFASLYLALNEIPDELDLEVVIVTNGTKDPVCFHEALQFAASFGELKSTKYSSEYDRNASRIQYFSSLANISCRVINTPTGSKSNAQNLGAEVGRNRGDRIIMSFDSDNLPMPDSIWKLYSRLHHHIYTLKDKTYIVSGTQKKEIKKTGNKGKDEILRGFLTNRNFYRNDITQHISGQMYGWDEIWRHETGDTILAMGQDYEKRLRAIITGGDCIKYDDISTWGYVPVTWEDMVSQSSRFVKSRLGLLERYRAFPVLSRHIEEIIMTERYYMRPDILERFSMVINTMLKNPEEAHWILANGFFWEYCRYKGKKLFKKDPTCRTWERLDSAR
jgi:hypothetical protein